MHLQSECVNVEQRQKNNYTNAASTFAAYRKREMLEFFGTYNHRIDDKGRVALPMKFRKTYERAQNSGEINSLDLVIAPSPSKYEGGRECLNVFTTEDFDEYVKSLFDVVDIFLAHMMMLKKPKKK